MANRRILSDGTLVVHEGLKNEPELKMRLNQINHSICEILENEGRHLSDVGLLINIMGNDLLKLSKDVFTAHDAEKNSLKKSGI